MSSAWVIRAGREGEREQEALSDGFAIAGWSEIRDLTSVRSKAQLRLLVRATYHDRPARVVASWVGQLWRLLDTIQVGDLVVMPLRDTPNTIAIGRVTGPYRYRTDAAEDRRHVRPVDWIQPKVSRTIVEQDLLYTMGSLLTIFQLKRNGAARRVSALADGSLDPGPADDEIVTSDLVTPDEMLERAAEVGNSTPISMTIRELLAEWGAARRTAPVVATIESDLAEKGLRTIPNFADGWLGDKVQLVDAAERVDADPAEPEAAASDGDSADDEPDDLAVASPPRRPLTLRVADLVQADHVLAFVRPDDEISRATTKMLRYNYSQLAVIAQDGTLQGHVSWDTIAQASMSRRKISCVDDAMHAPPLVAEHDDDLLRRAADIYQRGFIFVRSKDRKTVEGIVTAADMASKFHESTRLFSQLEEAEYRLRRAYGSTFSIDDLRAVSRTPKRITAVEDLTLGEHMHLLKDETNYCRLGWPLHHDDFIALLDEVRKIRNSVMHFSRDEVPQSQWSAIDGFIAMLKVVDPLV